jgi:hypothetical protein
MPSPLFVMPNGSLDDGFSGATVDPAPSTPIFSRKTPGKIRNPRVHANRGDPGEMPACRIETPTPADVTGTYGPEAEEWIAVNLGDRLRPWQRYVLGRALEHRADGSLRWGEVLLTVARQSGKTVLLRGLCGWRGSSAELFGEPQTVLSVANLKETALLPWRPVARMAPEWGARPRYQVGAERIEWADGAGTWLVQAANRNAGVGYSCGLIVVDEAWNVERSVVEGGLAPSQLERLDPQLWLISTAGDSASDLFAEHRSLALGQLSNPDEAELLILEWSAAPDADIDDRHAWRDASAHWSPRRLERLERLYRSTSPAEFRTNYLNQWVSGSARAWVSDLAWGRCRAPEREIPPRELSTIAIESHVSGEPFGLIHAGLDPDDGRVIVRGEVCASRRELWELVGQIAQSHRGVRLLYPDGFRHHVPRIPGVGETVKIAPSESYAAYNATVVAVRSGALAHASQNVLTEQVLSAVAYTVAERGTLLSSRASTGPIYLARALIWAVGFELRPERGHRPMVVAG